MHAWSVKELRITSNLCIIRYVLSFGKEAFNIQRVWTGHLGRKLFRRLVVAIEEFRFSKAAESNAIYKDR
jgi:hypothetical protein